jgi:hypothetical protein
MKLKRKLQHPVALVAQGFVAGVILFWATASAESSAQAQAQAQAQDRAPAAQYATR